MQNLNSIISKLSIDEKLGQLLVAHCFGIYKGKWTSYYKSLEKLVLDYHIGSFKIYHGFLYESFQLINQLQKSSKLPLIIAADLERGLGQQMEDVLELPPPLAISSTNSTRMAFEVGQLTAAEAKRIGINLLFGPLIDSCSPSSSFFGNRSFGENSKIVTMYSKEYIRGIKKEKIPFAIKYFPGHGRQVFVKNKTNKEIVKAPLINLEINDLKKNELIPFVELIKDGVDAVMTSHGAFPLIDSNRSSVFIKGCPATFSSVITTNLLRNELGFKGLIVTDALNLPVLRKYYSMAQIATKAFLAGADLLVLLGTLDEILDARNGLKKAYFDGDISEKDIDRRLIRILNMKRKISKANLKMESLSEKLYSNKTFLLSKQISDRSITLVNNKDKMVPIDNKYYDKLTVIYICDTVEQIKKNSDFSSYLEDPEISFKKVEKVIISDSCQDMNISSIIERSEKKSILVCVWLSENKSSLNRKQLINQFQEEFESFILVCLCPSFPPKCFLKIPTLIYTYHWDSIVRNSILNFICGT